MKHYIDSNDKIFAFESDGSQDHLIKPDMQPITPDEIAERNKPTQKQLNENRIAEIKSELDKLDRASVRPLRAINAGKNTQSDIDKLAELDDQADALRTELTGLLNENQ